MCSGNSPAWPAFPGMKETRTCAVMEEVKRDALLPVGWPGSRALRLQGKTAHACARHLPSHVLVWMNFGAHSRVNSESAPQLQVY